jgi:hypothetical protein
MSILLVRFLLEGGAVKKIKVRKIKKPGKEALKTFYKHQSNTLKSSVQV